MRSVLVAFVVSLLALAAGPARSAGPNLTLAAYDQVGDFWFIADVPSPTADGRITLNLLQIRRATRPTAFRPIKVEGRYLTVSCDFLTISEAAPTIYIDERDGGVASGAVPGDGPAPLLQPQGGLGDQLIRRLCGVDKPRAGLGFDDVPDAFDYARRHQPTATVASLRGPAPPPPEQWTGAFEPVSRSVDGAQLFLDRNWMVRSGDKVATRVLVVLGPTLNPAGEVVGIRNVTFDCVARTETLNEAWQWSLDRSQYSHAADIGWTRSLASRPFSVPLLNRACGNGPRLGPNRLVTFPTAAAAIASAQSGWPPPRYIAEPERDASRLPVKGRYYFTQEEKGNLLYVGVMEDQAEDGMVLYWLVAAGRRPVTQQGLTYSIAADLQQMDCRNARERNIGFLYLGADFKTLYSDRGIGAWKPVVPDTYGASVMGTVCDDIRPRWFGVAGLAGFQADFAKRRASPPEAEN